MPWRRRRDPYRTWVAEVLLQQTRVEQAIPYYARFLRRFPNVRALARATDSEVLRLWQGAGYYARARHLRLAARSLVREGRSELPRTVEGLQALPGVGPYIARAVASLAFGAPVVALEANGRRVAARWWGLRRDPRRPPVARTLERRLEAVLPLEAPGEFNEALMELGETICRPVAPQCPRCPVARDCWAFAQLDDPGSIPPPARRPRRPLVVAAVAVVEAKGRWLVQRRDPSGLLGGLYEFPGGKVLPGEAPEDAARRELEEETGLRLRVPFERLGVVPHAYSHFRVQLHVYRARLERPRRLRPGQDRRWVTRGELRRLPLPKATEKILVRIGRE